MVELRRDAEGILQRVGRGERLVLTYRGQPAARLEPIAVSNTPSDDPIYRLAELSVDQGGSLSNKATESRLRRLEAAEQIRLLKARYCDLCDAGYPADALCSLFTADGVWDGGEMGVFSGHEALHRFFSNMPSVMSFAVHHVTNSAVEVSEDATTAQGRWYLLQTATLSKTNQAVWLAAQYNDQLVCANGEWAFRHVSLRSRFYTTHEAGWAKLPHLLEQP